MPVGQWQRLASVTSGCTGVLSCLTPAQVHEVRYEVSVVYAPQGRVLDGAEQIYAHVGHSGWQDAHDVVSA